MEPHPYKKAATVLGMAAPIPFSAAAIPLLLLVLPGDRSRLSDERRLAYDLQICEAERAFRP